MSSMSLFNEDAAKATASVSAPPPAPVDQQVAAIMSSVNAEPLPETLDALKRIPDAVRPSVELLALEMYQEQFSKLAAAVVREQKPDDAAGGWIDPARRPNMLAHNAKLFVMSAVGHLSYQPWHVADAKTLKEIAADMERSGDFSHASTRLMALKPVNLFVAAAPDDDRDSYLKAVAAAIKGRRVHNVVLDAELIEWNPEAEFHMACGAIGMRPLHVGITERSKVGKHSMMDPATHPARLAALVIDTVGRQLRLDDRGAIIETAPEAIAPAAQPKPVPAVVAPAAAPEPTREMTPPPAGVQARINALREQQLRRRASARP